MQEVSPPSICSDGSRLLVVTDLDGTLLDHDTYSFEAALPALQQLSEANIPCIINTSKTAAELESLRQQFPFSAPFVIENGAAVWLPESEGKRWRCQAFGPARQKILEVLAELKSQYAFKGFSEMSVDDVIELTGLTAESATLALQREYTEPLIWQDHRQALAEFTRELAEVGLQTQRGGRFIHVMGAQCDKSHAMRWLQNHYAEQWQAKVKIIALGDGQNDVGMLSAADFPVVVRSPSHSPPDVPGRKDARLTRWLGPAGWNTAILGLLQELKITHLPTADDLP